MPISPLFIRKGGIEGYNHKKLIPNFGGLNSNVLWYKDSIS